MAEHTPTPWRVEGMTLWIVSDNVPKGRMHVADIRGWGYLTGKGEGALGLSDDEAFAIQEANAAYIVQACNAFPDLVKALEQIAAIENKDFGPDWEEIEEARKIATDALGRVKGAPDHG